MLVDANLLLYAVHKRVAQHEAAVVWLTDQLNGPCRVGLPWQSLGAFLRIAARPRARLTICSTDTDFVRFEEVRWTTL
jgi:predicted nucleic acid-binding protein